MGERVMPYRPRCSHCGLPILSTSAETGGLVYCCYGCFLVSRIVGGSAEDSQQSWSILRMGVGALPAMNVMTVSLMLYTRAVEPEFMPFFRWVLLGLATPAMLILGYRINSA